MSKTINFPIIEIKTLFRGLLFWKGLGFSETAQLKAFSYYHQNTDIMLLKALILYFLLELSAGHFLLITIAPQIAWPIFILGLLNLVYLVGVILMWRDNPVYIKDNTVFLRWGLRQHQELPFTAIQEIQYTNISRQELNQDDNLILSYLAEPNILISLKPEAQYRYGILKKRKIKKIALVLDKPSQFLQFFQEQKKNIVNENMVT